MRKQQDDTFSNNGYIRIDYPSDYMKICEYINREDCMTYKTYISQITSCKV